MYVFIDFTPTDCAVGCSPGVKSSPSVIGEGDKKIEFYSRLHINSSFRKRNRAYLAHPAVISAENPFCLLGLVLLDRRCWVSQPNGV